MKIIAPTTTIRDANGETRKVARVENTDGDPGDTIFIGQTEPSPTIVDGDAWLDGSSGVDLSELDSRIDMLEAAPELQSADMDEIDLPAPSGGVQLIGAGPALVRRSEDASDLAFVEPGIGQFLTPTDTTVPTTLAVADVVNNKQNRISVGRLASDVTVANNSIALNNVTGLSVDLGALTMYYMFGLINVTANSAADLRLAIAVTGETGANWYAVTAPTTAFTGAAATTLASTRQEIDTAVTGIGAINSGGVVLQINGVVNGGLSAGTVQVQMGQNSLHASDLIVKASSFIMLVPIDSLL